MSEQKTDCLFCKIVRKEIPTDIIYENKDVIAILDINPVSKGHSLVIPKQHFNTIEDCNEIMLSEIVKAAKKISPAITNTVSSEGFNVVINNKEAAGQKIEHLHLHIVPRNKNDGITIDKQKILHYEKQEFTDLAEKIRNLLK